MNKLFIYIFLGLLLLNSFQAKGQNQKKGSNTKLIQNFDSKFVSGKTDTLFLHMIEEIPADLCEQKQLKKLYIIGYDCDTLGQCKGIGEFPNCMGNLVNLEILTYGVTGITFIPEDIKNLKKMKVLCLNDNSALTDISNIKYLLNLEVLAFYGCNNLKNIENVISHLKHLKTLNLEGCYSITKAEIKGIKKIVPLNCKVTHD
jgi:Leucine-rich repeat (LRR) protein